MYQQLIGRPFAEWNALGRAVRAGEKAEHYLVSPDGTRAYALFREDQTEPSAPPDITGWSEVVTAEQWRERRKKPATIHVRAYGKDGLAVWCGSNKEVIDRLKKAGWKFNKQLCRWVKAPLTIERFAADCEKAGLRLVVDDE